MKQKVLIVDDEPSIRRLIGRVVSELGAEPVEVEDGALAAKAVSEHRPAVVLLDLHMPRLDGIAAIDDIRGAAPGVAIIVVTGDATDKRAKLAMDRGANAFLSKPIDVSHLKTVLEAHLLAAG
ncbi:MAG: response regulator [Elusimicrobia bacterium]|nr:response regulator [Elusimicrobiota bacterium]